MRTTAHRSTLAALTATALLGLTACSGAGSSSGSSASTSSEVAAGAGDAVARPAQVRAPGRARSQVQTKAVVRTGEIALTSRHLGRVRTEVDRVLRGVGGSVEREDTTNARDGSIRRSTLVLRVPVAAFERTRARLSGLGRLRSSTESQDDVTTQVIDTAERVQTLQNSLDRLQRFQRSATDVGDLIRYEEQITRRTSELQSLEAQQTYLTGQASMSTITLRLSTPETYVEPPGVLDHAGFLTGLGGGWHALGAFVVVVLTALGAALPFLVVLALVGAPVWLLLRRRRRQAAA